jgi:predicted outer membrane protein
VADSLGVMLPKKLNKDEQAEYDKLNGLSGKDFDTEYLTYIVKAHWHEAACLLHGGVGSGRSRLAVGGGEGR